jgi:DNA-binding MarR family transcriptional regulator
MRLTQDIDVVEVDATTDRLVQQLSEGDIAFTVAAISAMAARLERGKLAHREMDATDRRRVILRADDKGVEWVLDLFDSLFKASAALANTESVEDLERLLALMRRFRAVLAEHRPG